MSAPDDAVRRSARSWLEQHGEQAIAKARDVVAGLQASGEFDLADEWLRIIVAIEELRLRRAPD